MEHLMEQSLSQAGFSREPSFLPLFEDPRLWSKAVPYPLRIEIGVLLNGGSMEVYMCDCTIGCCGKPMGVFPFSLQKIDELLVEWKRYYEEAVSEDVPPGGVENPEQTQDDVK